MKTKTLILSFLCITCIAIKAQNIASIAQQRAQQMGLAFLSSMAYNDNQPVYVPSNTHIDVSILPKGTYIVQIEENVL